MKVGRAFDELHLLHATQFTDREEETVAKVRLNYEDGSGHEFPIGYGVHVRDWQRLQSEEREIYTDPDTKVIWRGPGVARFKSTTRLSKTRLVNPFPDRVVLTIDFVSTGKVASYDVAAATVARRDPNRPVTPAVPLDRPEWNFDGRMLVRVVDEAGQPVEGALVSPNISVAGSICATVATPLYTAADGAGTVKYPKNESSCLYFVVQKEGWRRIEEDPWVRLGRVGAKTNGIVVTIRMVPEATAAVVAAVTGGQPAAGTNASTSVTTVVPPGAGRTTTVIPGSGSGASSATTQVSRIRPILIIDYPVGSNVRVEFADDLNVPMWQPLTNIINLPFSPYPYVCGGEAPPQPQRFYRAVIVQ